MEVVFNFGAGRGRGKGGGGAKGIEVLKRALMARMLASGLGAAPFGGF